MVTLTGYILMFALILAGIYLIMKFKNQPKKEMWQKKHKH